MKNFISLQWLGTLTFAILVAMAFVFVFLPTAPEVPSVSDVSTKALTVLGCCGGGDGPGGSGDSGSGDLGHDDQPPVSYSQGSYGSYSQGSYAPPSPTCDLNINPTSIASGGSATLTWSTTNANSVSIDQGIGSVNANDNTSVSPTSDTTYTLTATGSGGTVTCDATITVTQPVAPTCTLSANPTAIDQGNSSTLTWTTTNADTVSIDQGIGSVAKNDSQSVAPTSDTTYTLTATGSGGTVTCDATITVTPVPNAPTCTLSANPTSITSGGSSTLTWTTTNANTVSIDQGIGAVALNDSTSVSPTSDTTYTLTATGAGGTVTCNAAITVTSVTAPTCALSAVPTSINQGGNSILNWTTTNANTITIDQGIGTVAATDSTSVSPATTTTYTLTATGAGGTVTCDATVTVVPVPNAPTCTLGASPTAIPLGATSTLSWTTTNADTVSIDQGIGSVATSSGTQDVAPTSDTTYTLTATGSGGTVTCTAPITISAPSAPTCDLFTADPTVLSVGGGDSVLTWETTNATDVSIDQGIGSVVADGSQTVNVSSTNTYTLTAGDGTATTTCTATVTVDTGGGGGGGGGGGSSSPRCDLFEVSETLANGDIVLHWETRRGRDIKIEPGVLESDKSSIINEGFATVTPQTNVRYTLTVERGSRSDTCILDVDPEVTIDTVRDQQPLTAIAFTEIPHTGFPAGPALTFFFYTVLVLWSLGIAYILVIKRGTVLGFSLPMLTANGIDTIHDPRILPHEEYKSFRDEDEEEYVTAVSKGAGIPRSAVMKQTQTQTMTPQREILVPYSMPANVSDGVPSNLPTTGVPVAAASQDVAREDTEDEEEDTATGQLEQYAHLKNVLLSSDALRLIVDQHEKVEDQKELLDAIVNRAKESFPREDGWLIINRERISAILKSQKNKTEDKAENQVKNKEQKKEVVSQEQKSMQSSAPHNVSKEPARKEEPRKASNGANEQNRAPQVPARQGHVRKEQVVEKKEEPIRKEERSHAAPVRSLAEAIIAGDTANAYKTLGSTPMAALASAAHDLDAVYRARKGEPTTIPASLIRAASGVSDEKLAHVITTLTCALDGMYDDEAAAVRIAIIKALKIIV